MSRFNDTCFINHARRSDIKKKISWKDNNTSVARTKELLAVLAFGNKAETIDEWQEQMINLELLSSYFFDFISTAIAKGINDSFSTQ